jgi:hypothetical protein
MNELNPSGREVRASQCGATEHSLVQSGINRGSGWTSMDAQGERTDEGQ